MMTDKLKILMIAAEAVPFVKIGGLADVVGSLPKALRKLGHDVRICIPGYAFIDRAKFRFKRTAEILVPMGDDHHEPALIEEALHEGNIPVYAIGNTRYFGRERVYGYSDDDERFLFFSRAVLEMLKKSEWCSDVLHCNDWHTGVIPNYLKTIYENDPFFKHAATVFTIHNLAYQGACGPGTWRKGELEGYDSKYTEIAEFSSFMSRGIFFSDVVNTVSEKYALEIQTPEYGEGLDLLFRKRRERLFGILNGLDYEDYDPATDKRIPVNYDATAIEKKKANKLALQKECNLPVNSRMPLMGIVSRLVSQKGLDLVANAIHGILLHDLQLVFLGTGDEYFERLFRGIAQKFPTKICVNISFDPDLARRIYAGSDMLLMPSQFEPCGLSQLIAMRYGTVPVVRATGGLADTVKDFNPSTGKGNGFVFELYNHWVLFSTIVRAVETFKHKAIWSELIKRGMSADHSWMSSARNYVQLYKKALEFRRKS